MSRLVSAVSICDLEFKIKYKRNQVDLRPQLLIETLRDNDVEELSVTHYHAEHAARLTGATVTPGIVWLPLKPFWRNVS